jgi:hypothetical protein
MITRCQHRSRAVQNLRTLKNQGLDRCLSLNSTNVRFVIGKGANQRQFHVLTSCSSTAPLSRHLIEERNFCTDKCSAKTLKTKVNTEDEKNTKGDKTHKPLLISHSNSTRMKNDKIRQKEFQGEDDRQQNEAMVATSVSITDY